MHFDTKGYMVSHCSSLSALYYYRRCPGNKLHLRLFIYHRGLADADDLCRVIVADRITCFDPSDHLGHYHASGCSYDNFSAKMLYSYLYLVWLSKHKQILVKSWFFRGKLILTLYCILPVPYRYQTILLSMVFHLLDPLNIFWHHLVSKWVQIQVEQLP